MKAVATHYVRKRRACAARHAQEGLPATSGVSKVGEPTCDHRIDPEGQAIFRDRIAYLRRIEAGMSVTWETSVCVNPLSARGLSLRIRPGGESITFIRTTIDMSTSAC